MSHTRPPSSQRATAIADVMASDVICVAPDLPITALAELFLDRGISGAPVVDATGQPIGVVSKTDLIAIGSQRRAPDALTAKDIMMPVVFSLPEDASLSRAAALMAYEGVHRLPVVSPDGRVTGVLSALDVLRWLARSDGYLTPT